MSNLFRLIVCLSLSVNIQANGVEAGFPFAEQKLTPSDGSIRDYFGNSVSVFGNTAFIGAPNEDTNGQDSGSVYIFEQEGGQWTQTQKIIANDGTANDFFGRSIAVNNEYAVIGAPQNHEKRGAVYIFKKINGSWAQHQKLTVSELLQDDQFGFSVDIDNDLLIIGAYRKDLNIPNSPYVDSVGAAYVYRLEQNLWSQETILTPCNNGGLNYACWLLPGDLFGMRFGQSVSIDDSTVVIGAPLQKGGGAAYIFEYENDGWEFFHDWDCRPQCSIPLQYSDPTNPYFYGFSVSVKDNRVLIGAKNHDTEIVDDHGIAYIYSRVNGSWNKNSSQQLLPSDSTNLYFSEHVHLNGSSAFVSSPYDDDVGTNCGAVFRFSINNNQEEDKIVPAHNWCSSANFGANISTSGSTVLIGSSEYFGDGFAYIYHYPSIITGDFTRNTIRNTTISGNIAATDVDGLVDGTVFSVISPPAQGQSSINPSTGNWTYTSGNSFFGQDIFTIRVTDDLGGTTDQVITINIIDPDDDSDGVGNSQDNCPSIPNPNQNNLDSDPFGDVCDDDKDGDGIDAINDINDMQQYLATDPDGDGVDSTGITHFSSNVCLLSPGCNPFDSCMTVCYVPPQDNCPNSFNPNQENLDNDILGDVCDSDIDGDGFLNQIEAIFLTDEYDGSEKDKASAIALAQQYIMNLPVDSDQDGIPDQIEYAADGNATSSTFESVLAILSVNKNVPAMGGMGLLALGLSMLGLGAVRLRK